MHKAIKPVVSDDDDGVETHDGIASLPLKSIAELVIQNLVIQKGNFCSILHLILYLSI